MSKKIIIACAMAAVLSSTGMAVVAQASDFENIMEYRQESLDSQIKNVPNSTNQSESKELTDEEKMEIYLEFFG